ncbi:MAG TPA: tetratricopeptide repeat protein [Anaerolineae bacterium]|nr:tetratricopeptide repeat protein [Anaerolineae bacterium]
MVYVVETEPKTPADELRELLTRCENRLPNLKGSGQGALDLLHWVDRIHELIPELEATGVDLRPERGRLLTIEAQLRKRAALIVGEARAVGGLAMARQKVSPEPERWWWYLDEYVTQQRRRRLRRIGITLVIVAGVLALIYVLFRILFPPNPVAVAVQTHQMNAEELLSKGDVHGALQEMEAALEVAPDDPSLHIWVGVLSEMEGDEETAQQQFTVARSLSENQAGFLVQRSYVYGATNQADEALEDARKAVELAPEMAEAYFALGSAAEQVGQLQEALSAFNRCSELAADSNPALTALARVRIATLLQRTPGLASPSGFVTPTLTAGPK